jgi:hypothetical protein
MKVEKKMNRIKVWVAISAFGLLVLGLPAIASAQYYPNDPYGRNGGYNNGQYGRNGGYGNYGDMRSTIRDLKNRTRDFQRELDRDLDNSRYNGTRREDEINRLARDFRNAVGRLNDNGNYDRRNDSEVRRVLDLGYQIDRSIGRSRMSYGAQGLWSGIRRDLDVLRSSSQYNSGGYNNGRYGNGRNGLPSWWPF